MQFSDRRWNWYSETMHEKKLKPGDLEKGMYVSRLDRPWEETPYLLQGVRIESQKDIELLRQYCEYVYVDLEIEENKNAISSIKTSQPDPGDDTLSKLKLTHYSVNTPTEEELPRARKYRDELLSSVRDMMKSARQGKNIDIQNIELCLSRVEESILRNPSASMLLRLLKEKDYYTYEHCVDVSALSIIVGRRLGLPRDVLDRLALGAILFDIGKMQIPDDILNKNERLSEAEYEIVKKHVSEGLKIVSNIEDIDKSVLDIIATHHERYNGCGYPAGLEKKSIPILGRIVGIADCYDAMTSNRSYNHALPNDQVISQIYSWRNTLFQDEIVEYFIQAIGIYPVGSVVELNNGEVGIVIAQNDLRRLRPKVMIVLDSDKTPLFTNRIRDLYHETAKADGDSLDISKGVEAEKYGLNPKEFFF